MLHPHVFLATLRPPLFALMRRRLNEKVLARKAIDLKMANAIQQMIIRKRRLKEPLLRRLRMKEQY